MVPSRFIKPSAPIKNAPKPGALLIHERMGSDRRPAADVAVGVTSTLGGSPCCLSASHPAHGRFALTGFLGLESGNLELTGGNGGVQLVGGHGHEGHGVG